MEPKKGQRLERRLAAIFAADVAGYARLMNQDEAGTLRALAAARKAMDSLIAEHGGRIANTAGDSVLAEFPSAVEAVQCAVAVQHKLAEANSEILQDRRLQFRIGVHLGDVAVRGADLLGEGVNLAARLEGLAEPGGVCLSEAVHAFVRKALPLAYTDLGEQAVKGLDERVKVYAVKPAAASPRPSESKPLPLPDKPSIAVLPFTNMSGDPEQEYFADGVVEDIITALSRVRCLFVIARNSSFTYKSKTVDIRQVGRELGVRYVLEGSVRRVGTKVRITGQLIESQTGRHIWADKLDGGLEDIFALQDQVTRMVVGAIEPSLRLAEIERVRAKRTSDLGAYELYLRALYALSSYSERSLREAEDLLRTALTRDPNYADAWALRATNAVFRSVGGFLGFEEAKALGVEAAHRAVRADPDSPLALASAAATLCVFGSDHEQALEFADRALTLAPSASQVLTFCAFAFNFNGLPEKALPLLLESRRLSPRDPRGFVVLDQVAVSHFFSRRFSEAIGWAERNVQQHPNFAPSRYFLISALAHSGRIEEARNAARSLLRIQPEPDLSMVTTVGWRYPWMVGLLGDGLRLAGLPESKPPPRRHPGRHAARRRSR